jgi:hypothetical protein
MPWTFDNFANDKAIGQAGRLMSADTVRGVKPTRRVVDCVYLATMFELDEILYLYLVDSTNRVPVD